MRSKIVFRALFVASDVALFWLFPQLPFLWLFVLS